MADGYDAMVAGFINDYRRAPWDWKEVTPGPGDRWHGPGPFLQHRARGMIIRHPDAVQIAETLMANQEIFTSNEREPMTTQTQNTPSIGGIGAYPGGGFPPLSPLLEPGEICYRSQIKLGERYREQHTGYEGHATAIYFYENSCERVELESYSKKHNTLTSLTFDAKRLEHIASGKVVDSKEPGGPDRGNPRRSTPKR